jgi:hypothetical protein
MDTDKYRNLIVISVISFLAKILFSVLIFLRNLRYQTKASQGDLPLWKRAGSHIFQSLYQRKDVISVMFSLPNKKGYIVALTSPYDRQCFSISTDYVFII